MAELFEKSKETQARQDYFKGEGAWQESVRQDDGTYVNEDKGSLIFNPGSSISKNYKMTDKARRLINYFLLQGLGYRCGVNTLIKKTWGKWEGTRYTTKDVLTQADIASAIKGMYLGIVDGSLKFADGVNKMLKVTMNADGVQEVKLTEFVEGVFTIKEGESKKEEGKATAESKEGEGKVEGQKVEKELSVLETLKALLGREGLSDLEKGTLELAVKTLEK